MPNDENTPALCAIAHNPLSGQQNQAQVKQLLMALQWLFSQQDYQIRSIDLSKPKAGQMLEQVMQAEGLELLVIAGGDGTINQVVEAMMRKEPMAKPAILLVPSGSANGLATDLGMPALENFSNFLQEKQQKTMALDLLELKFQQSKTKYALHIADFGLNAALVHAFEEGQGRGMSAYFKRVFKVLSERKSMKAKILADGQEVEAEVQMLALSNSRLYGTQAELNPWGLINDGKVELCLLKPFEWYEAIPLTWRFFTHGNKENDLLEYISAKEGHIKLEHSADFQYDGEFLGKIDELHFKVLPQRLNFWVPPTCPYLPENP